MVAGSKKDDLENLVGCPVQVSRDAKTRSQVRVSHVLSGVGG